MLLYYINKITKRMKLSRKILKKEKNTKYIYILIYTMYMYLYFLQSIYNINFVCFVNLNILHTHTRLIIFLQEIETFDIRTEYVCFVYKY